MRRRIADALGKAAVAYPFLLGVTVVVVAIETSRASGRPGDFIGWLLWLAIWLTVAAFAAAIYVVPLLGLEFLVWAWIVERVPALDSTRSGTVASAAAVALPWALAPPARSWFAAGLVFAGVLTARSMVPALGVGTFQERGEAGA